MLIDTHCHLSYEGLVEDPGAVMARAAAAGVERVISVGTDPADHTRVMKLMAGYEHVFGAVGFHPNHAAEAPAGVAAAIEPLFVQSQKLLAVGEIGLDYFRNNVPKDLQHAVLTAQLELARKLKKPVILHVRDAHADALAVMRSYLDLKFVVHCFTGTPAECRAWLDLGAYVGITGIVTYKNAPDVREDAKLIPEDRLLLETDAPFLSPEPVRKVRVNEPAHLAHVARYVAGLRGVTERSVAETTTQNAAALFGEALPAAR